MSVAPISVSESDVGEDRFSRYRLLRWWDQDRIAQTKVLVVGAGALGNEILKNLALLGFRKVLVVDGDTIEISNLSRSVLFRQADIGKTKVAAAAAAATDLYPDAVVQPLRGNILLDVGLGVFHWADVILAGLDNREARLWINRSAWKLGRPWIDGAIEGLKGIARMFLPGTPPCYECTLGATDWAILDRRMSCNLLTHAEREQGRVPTTPTTSSVIAGVEVQEALKYIHGLPVLAGKGFFFDGMEHSSYTVQYTENPDCFSHYQVERIVTLPERSCELTLQKLFERACDDLQSRDVTVEFSRDIVAALKCPLCSGTTPVFRPVGAISAEEGLCPNDSTMRSVETVQSYTGSGSLGTQKLSNLGLPAWDLLTARTAESEIGYLIGGDADEVLGRLAKA